MTGVVVVVVRRGLYEEIALLFGKNVTVQVFQGFQQSHGRNKGIC
jgi:hypothetical protein